MQLTKLIHTCNFINVLELPKPEGRLIASWIQSILNVVHLLNLQKQIKEESHRSQRNTWLMDALRSQIDYISIDILQWPYNIHY